MDALLTLLAGWPGARWLQASGTAYLCVNAAHILGIGLLVGGIVPLDLRLAGFFRTVPLRPLVRLLPRMAGAGLALAMATGLWLFSVDPHDYAGNPAFLAKLGLLLLALANVAWQHGSRAWRRVRAEAVVSPGVRARAIASSLLWVSALLAGRWIGFL